MTNPTPAANVAEIAIRAELKARREALGFSLRDVEAITNGRISNALLSQVEGGKIKSPSLGFAIDLAAAYAVSLDQMAEWLGQFTNVMPPAVCPTCGQHLNHQERADAKL